MRNFLPFEAKNGTHRVPIILQDDKYVINITNYSRTVRQTHPPLVVISELRSTGEASLLPVKKAFIRK